MPIFLPRHDTCISGEKESFNRLYAIDANWRHVREAPLTPIGVNYNGHRHSASAKHLVVSLWAWLPACGDCPLLRYGFRSRSDLLYASYEYRYLSVDDNGDRSGYVNGTFSTTKL